MLELDSASDDELVERIQSRDEQAFSILMNRYLTRIYSFVYRMVGNEQDARDIVQETFLRLWSKASSWEQGRVKFTTWLHRLARNLCIDLYRKRRFDTVPIDSTAEIAADDSVPDSARSRAVVEALGRLPEKQRTAIVLCTFEGWTNRQAAEVLRVSVEAVESLLSRARRTLRDDLARFREVP